MWSARWSSAPRLVQMIMKVTLTIVVLLFGAHLLWGEDTPIYSLPYSPSLDLSSMDRAVDPCTDFYRYSCGWFGSRTIPSLRTRRAGACIRNSLWRISASCGASCSKLRNRLRREARWKWKSAIILQPAWMTGRGKKFLLPLPHRQRAQAQRVQLDETGRIFLVVGARSSSKVTRSCA